MNLGEIIIKLRNRLTDETANIDGEFNDSELVVYINQAMSWFCRVLKDYKVYSTNTISIGPITSHPKVVGSAEFALPNNSFETDKISVYWTENDELKKTALIKCDKDDIESIYPDEGALGDPRYYYEENYNVGIYPIKENTIYNISGRYIGIQKLNSINDVLYFREEVITPFLDACEYYSRITRPNVSNNLNVCQILYASVQNFFNERGKIDLRK